MNKDLHNNIFVVMSLTQTDITTNTTTVGTRITDSSTFEAMEFVPMSGALAGGNFEILIEEGEESNLSDAVPVPANFLIGTPAEATLSVPNQIKRIGCLTKKRYVRASIVSTGVSGSNLISIMAIVAHPHSAPRTNN